MAPLGSAEECATQEQQKPNPNGHPPAVPLPQGPVPQGGQGIPAGSSHALSHTGNKGQQDRKALLTLMEAGEQSTQRCLAAHGAGLELCSCHSPQRGWLL